MDHSQGTMKTTDTPARTLRIYGLVSDSIVDGPGLRYAIFVQGCTHHCPGCHNPESQPSSGGTVYTIDELYAQIKANGLVNNVTFSGGEPFQQPKACAALAARLKHDGYGIWAYTGYLYEDLKRMEQHNPAIGDFLQHIDVLVDGPYKEALHSYDATWRGSTNQRLIDVPASLASNTTIEWEQPTFEVGTIPNW